MLQNIVTCQLKLNLPKLIQQNACGVACIIQVLKFKNKLKLKEEEIFLDFLCFGKYTFPQVELELDGLSQPVPFSVLDPSKNTLEGIRNEILQFNDIQNLSIKNISINNTVKDLYLPTFLLKTGSDSRGISEYLEHLDVKCKLYEFSSDKNISSKNIKHTLLTDKNIFMDKLSHEINLEKMMIVSVKMDSFPHLKEASKTIYNDNIADLTHLVCVIKENDNIFILDPLIEKSSDAVIQTNLDQLRLAMMENRKKSRFIVID